MIDRFLIIIFAVAGAQFITVLVGQTNILSNKLAMFDLRDSALILYYVSALAIGFILYFGIKRPYSRLTRVLGGVFAIAFVLHNLGIL